MEVFYTVVKIPEDTEYRGVAEIPTSGGLLHVVVYGFDETSTFCKLHWPVQRLLGHSNVVWVETNAPIPY